MATKLVWLDEEDIEMILAIYRTFEPDDLDYDKVHKLAMKIGGDIDGN